MHMPKKDPVYFPYACFYEALHNKESWAVNKAKKLAKTRHYPPRPVKSESISCGKLPPPRLFIEDSNYKGKATIKLIKSEPKKDACKKK
jgi:hypothetical protein